MPHLDPDRLALLALGEQGTDTDESAHLLSCSDCAGELEDLSHTAAVGRASMDGMLETPSPQVWRRVTDELGFTAEASAAEPARVRRRTETRDTSSRRPWVWALAAAAAVALFLGVGIGGWALLRPGVTQLASATLDALPDHAGAVGAAAIEQRSDGSRTLSVTLDSSASAPGYREVWLLTEDASGLISLGLLDGDRGDFVVPANVDLERYPVVDVSIEPTDGDPTHSGDSIVRGQLTFA